MLGLQDSRSGYTAYAADYEHWEDCDWDGYDDHTGVAVPWPGFDGTRGDTPAGPSPDSQTGKKQAQEAAKEETTSDSTGSKATSGSSSSSSSSSSTSSKSKTNAKSSSKKSSSGKTAAGTASDKTAAAITAADADEAGAVITDDKDAVAEPGTPVVTAAAKSPEELQAELEAAQNALDDAVVARKGAIEVSDADGSALHAGGVLIITGDGFYGDVGELEVEIHSTPALLGTVSTDADGSFALEVVLPGNIGEGAHNIVVLYKGAEVTRQPVELGPAPADSFLKALSVGLGFDNVEFLAGVVILGSLAALSGLALAINAAVRRGRRGRQTVADNAGLI
jgi:hypothetical protein